MPTPRGRQTGGEKETWPDTRLVRACLRGHEEAWAALIDKYKNLIYSIPIKYGFSRDDAADVFQAVCLELLAELPRLREPKALPAWLIQVTAHKCFHGKKQQERYVSQETFESEPAQAGETAALPEEMLHQVEQEQALRQVLAALSPRCQALIRALFYETPARPYRELARSLGIATGSIGFIRGRCLERLKRGLEKLGFK